MQIDFLFIQNDIAKEQQQQISCYYYSHPVFYMEICTIPCLHSIYKTMNKLCRMKMQLKLLDMYIHNFPLSFPSLKSHFQLYSHNKNIYEKMENLLKVVKNV